jgi:hypothetical protein
LVAATAKVVDRRAWRSFVAVLAELSSRYRRPLAYLALTVEVAVAVLLILPAVALGISSSAFLMLMMAFTAAQLWLLAHGSESGCACFGTLFAASIGVTTVARNVALLALGWALLALRGQASRGSASVILLSYLGLLATVAISLALLSGRQPEPAQPPS